MVRENKWKISKELLDNDKENIIKSKLHNFIRAKKDTFPNFGGDIETFISKIKLEHATKIFGKTNDSRKIITETDLEKGHQVFMDECNRKKETYN